MMRVLASYKIIYIRRKNKIIPYVYSAHFLIGEYCNAIGLKIIPSKILF